MSRKRPRTSTAGPRSICHWTNDDGDDGVGASLLASSLQQSTLHAFFVTGSPTLKRNSLRSKHRAIPTTPCLANTQQVSGTVPTVSPQSNPIVATGSPIPSPPKKKQWKQVYLDCGQSRFGQQLCESCGMLYMPGVMEDTKAHAVMCKERCLGVVWRQVRGQRTYFQDNQGDCIVSFLPTSQVLPVSFESVYRQVAQDLGMEATTSSKLVGHSIWLYLRNHRVIGFVATKPISNAFYLVACPIDETTNDRDNDNDNDNDNNITVTDKTSVGDRDPLLTSADRVKTKAILGVAIMWTHPKFRNQGIATALIDSARHHAFFGMTVPTNKLAFSSPTHAGWTFGKKYCGNPLLYDYCDTDTERTDPGNQHTSDNG